MLKKVYVEITNVCNLRCGFCRGTARAPRFMTAAEFRVAAEKLRPYTQYIYLHVLGEPLAHPDLAGILAVCRALDFKVTLVTNGVLLPRAARTLEACGCLYKICWSLHAFEANDTGLTQDEYLSPILLFAGQSAEKGVINVFKFWNGGGRSALNQSFTDKICAYFGCSPAPNARGFTVGERLYIDYADQFAWPDLGAEETPPRFCMALRDQLGVLSDGTAVPCCLDADGELRLGNLFTDKAEDVLNCALAKRIVQGFSEGRAPTPLCRRCDFAKRRFG